MIAKLADRRTRLRVGGGILQGLCLGILAIGVPARSAGAEATPVTVPGAEQFDVRARSGSDYRIFVAAPDHQPPESGWPVIYLTDANSNFLPMLAAARKQSRAGLTTVIVGIGYPTDDRTEHSLRRSWDLTPSTSPEWQAQHARGMSIGKTGGQHEFLSFIDEELKPMIAKKHSIDQTRQALFGHSFGGLFALHVLFQRPEAFQTYLVTSPSIWWNDRSILQEKEKFLRAAPGKTINARVLFMVGDLEQATEGLPEDRLRVLARREMVAATRQMNDSLAKSGIKGLTARYREFAGEDHLSVVLPAVHHGARFVLETPGGGVPVGPQDAPPATPVDAPDSGNALNNDMPPAESARGPGRTGGGRPRSRITFPPVLDQAFLRTRLPRDVQYLSDIVFKTVDDTSLKLDLLLPKVDSPEALPVVVWIHGGAWMRGNKAHDLHRFDQLTSRVLREGMAFVSIEYRLSGQAKFPAQIQDCNDALAFLHRNRKKYNLKTDAIVVMGTSAGGHLASLVGTVDPARTPEFAGDEKTREWMLRGVVNFYGPSDLLVLQAKREGMKEDEDRSPEALLLGHSPLDRPDLARAASPTTYAGKHAPPFLILHGDKDVQVPITQSVLLNSFLRLHGVQSQLIVVEDAQHGDEKFDDSIYNDHVIRFLQSVVK